MNDNHSAFERLRTLAEDILQSQRGYSSLNTDMTNTEFKEVLHELQVYQIELEIQNEELRAAQDELAASRREFSNLFEHAPIAYFIVDARGIIAKANHTAAQKFGRPQAELQGLPLVQLIERDARDTFYFHRRQLLKSRKPQTGEFTFICPDGNGFVGQLESVLVDAAAGNNTFRAAIMDISEIKQAEAALQQSLQQKRELSALKSRLIEVISHELRTPLSTILTSVHLLENLDDETDVERKQRLCERIRSGVWYLESMVSDVVAAHRSGDDTPELKAETFDVVAFTRHLIDDIGAVINESGRVEFSVQNTHDIETVTLDQRLLRHIITNLLQNAIKYSDTAVTFSQICAENTITFEVEDQGTGIPKGDQEHIFEMFYRGANAVSIPGTGVGLAVVKSAVEAHNGTLHFVTSINGTTFTVRLPRVVQ